ncbi:hypothetical protein LDENG_00246060, partial [Lucifuga dentata]
QSFLDNLNLPQLSTEYSDTLDTPLTITELHKSLSKMPNGKAPGPDGFPAEFLKHFWQMLAPLFFRTVTEIKNKGQISPHMNTAAIKLLLKPDKDPTVTSSYRLLSEPFLAICGLCRCIRPLQLLGGPQAASSASIYSIWGELKLPVCCSQPSPLISCV